MKLTTKVILMMGALSMAACTNAGKLGGSAGDGAFGPNAAGNSGVLSGSASDSASTAYFQQAVGDRVTFEVDQSSLTAAGRATLDGQATWLLTNADYTAIIEGHADEQGTREYNIALGNRRADAARSYLVSKGVPSPRMQIVSYGKERPIEICSQEACYAKNRRAVTVLAGGLTG
jgi:peptidoglycan-associated lipoprotein